MAERLRPYRSWLAPVAAPDAQRVWLRIETRVRPSRQRWLVLAPALAAVAVGAFLAGYLLMATPERSGVLLLSDGSTPSALTSDAGAKTVELSDGSRIELQEHTHLRTLSSTATSFETELARGRAVFDVVPHGPRVWRVSAADVQVTVLGTRFSVELEQAFVRVAVERGRVQVSSARLGGTRVLQANESLQLQLKPEPAPPQPAPAADSGDAVPRRTHHEKVPKRAKVTSVPSTSIEELLHSADGARASGQPGKAASALERAVSEHARDARAGLAAFTLAQLYMEQLAQPRDAATAFGRAVALGLPASLAEEASARRVEAYVRAGDPAQAQKAAQAYRNKYPRGARTAAVARWLAELQ